MPLAKLGDVELYFEEPDLFNRHVAEFLAAVEAGRWAGRS
jgi:hypothetical protein